MIKGNPETQSPGAPEAPSGHVAQCVSAPTGAVLDNVCCGSVA